MRGINHVAVVVVGAGLSGLSAARLLSQRGLDVVVLEATDRVGGRACTNYPGSDDPQYGWADMGGTFVSATDLNVVPLCRELGMETVDLDCSETLESILFEKGRAYPCSNWQRDLFWRNPIAAWDLAIVVRRMEKMCWAIPVDNPWDAPHARQWDQMTVKEFLDRHCWTKFCKTYLTSVLRILTASQESHMSLLFYLWEMRLANRRKHMLGWSNSSEDYQVMLDGGSQQMALKMATDLKNPVVLNEPVVSIAHSQNQVRVLTLHGREYTADYVILATPAGVQMKIHFEPPLSSMRSSLVQRSPLGCVMKCVVFYAEPFWEESGVNGFVTCLDPDEVVGAVDAFNKEGVKIFGLQCLIFQQHVVKLEGMSDARKQEEVCQSLARFFQSEKAFTPVKFLCKSWTTEPYQYGGYSSFYPPGVLTSFGPAMRAPIGSRVFLAGTDTATHLRGYMSGAIDAGQRAAREVLHAEGKIQEDEVWVQDSQRRWELNLMEEIVPSIELVIICLATLALGIALLVGYCIN